MPLDSNLCETQSNRKITLITPPYERIAQGYEFIKHVTNQAPTLGLLHLAAEVRRHDYVPTIIESDIFDLEVEDVVAQVVRDEPAYVGITLFTVGVWCGAEIARKIKFALPETVIIVGGPHISSMAEETMQRFREFDYAVVGEGEEILVNLLNRLEAGGKVDDIAGLGFVAGLPQHIPPGVIRFSSGTCCFYCSFSWLPLSLQVL